MRVPLGRPWLREQFHAQLLECAQAALAQRSHHPIDRTMDRIATGGHAHSLMLVSATDASEPAQQCHVYLAAETREHLDALVARATLKLPQCVHWTHRNVTATCAHRYPRDVNRSATPWVRRAPDHGDHHAALATDLAAALSSPRLVGTLDSSLSELVGAAAGSHVLLARYPPGVYVGKVRDGAGLGEPVAASSCVHANARWPQSSRDLPGVPTSLSCATS